MSFARRAQRRGAEPTRRHRQEFVVEQWHLPVRKTLEKLGASRASFYPWCDLYQASGTRGPGRQTVAAVTRVEPDPRQDAQEIVQLALDEPELSPREKATSSRKIPSTACLRHMI